MQRFESLAITRSLSMALQSGQVSPMRKHQFTYTFSTKVIGNPNYFYLTTFTVIAR